MQVKGSNTNELLSTATGILHFIFSWIVLLTISIIISGKFAAKAFPMGFMGDDKFVIDVYMLKLKATGDEVTLGFSFFIVCLVACIFFGGVSAYEFFKLHSGIDIGQWNSLCVISSGACLLLSILMFFLSKLLRSPRLVSEKEREELIKRLKND
jgi:hypothetical protein